MFELRMFNESYRNIRVVPILGELVTDIVVYA